MARLVGLGGSVIAFEPYEPAMKLLQENIELNQSQLTQNITCIDKAVSNKEGSAFLVNAYDSHINIGDSFVTNFYNPSAVVFRGTDKLSVHGTTIQCITLDQYITDCYEPTLREKQTQDFRIDFIKLDVQGYELFALQGGEAMLRKYKPTIAVELEESCLLMNKYGSKELCDYIRGLGYEIFYLESDYPCDHICIHQDRLGSFLANFSDKIQDHTENNLISNNYACGIRRKIVLK
jgi:FkbM family methyltransferase